MTEQKNETWVNSFEFIVHFLSLICGLAILLSPKSFVFYVINFIACILVFSLYGFLTVIEIDQNKNWKRTFCATLIWFVNIILLAYMIHISA